MLSEIPHSPPVQICSNLPSADLKSKICWKKYPPPLEICSKLLSEIQPTCADLLKSAGRNIPIPHLWRFAQICHCKFAKICCQKYPPLVQICSNLPLQICSNLPPEVSPTFGDLLKSATTHLQICSNLLAEIYPTCADFLKSTTGDLLKSTSRNTPHLCRFAKICHWKFAQIC